MAPSPGIRSPGIRSPEACSPLAATARVRYNGHLSTLPGRRQLAAKDCSGKVARCPEIPDKRPSLSSPPRANLPEGKSQVAGTFFSGWGCDASFFSCWMQWHRYLISLILNLAICQHWNRFQGLAAQKHKACNCSQHIKQDRSQA